MEILKVKELSFTETIVNLKAVGKMEMPTVMEY